MNSKPMLGDHELSGVESIVSAETRSLAEHSVPGLAAGLAKLQSLNRPAGVGAPIDELGDIGVTVDASSLLESVTGVQGEIEERLAALPADPGPLLAPLLTRIDETRWLPDTLREQAINAIDALTSVPDLADPTRSFREAMAGVLLGGPGL